jgi:hypothetical protein
MNSNEKKKTKSELSKPTKPKKKRSLVFNIIVSLIAALAATGILYLRMRDYDLFLPMEFNILLGTCFLVVFSLVILTPTIKLRKEQYTKLTDEQKTEKQKSFYLYAKLLFCFITTAAYFALNFETFSTWGLMKSVTALAAMFGFVFMAWTLFGKVTTTALKKFVNYPYRFLMRVLIPMMPFYIILLGAIHTKYPYQSTFFQDIITRTGTGIISDTILYVVKFMYHLGESRPVLWIFLTLAAFFVLVYWSIVGKYPIEDEPSDAQDIIDEVEEEKKKGKKGFKEILQKLSNISSKI